MAAKRANNAHADVESAHPHALTRRNMRDFNRAERSEEARRKGESTPVTKNSGREYRTSQSSLPPLKQDVVQNITRKHKTKASGEELDHVRPLFQEPYTEGDNKFRVKQKHAEDRAERMKATGLELNAEKEAKRKRQEEEEARKRHNGAGRPNRQQFSTSVQASRVSVKPPPGNPGLPQAHSADVASLFPPEFPRFQSVQNVNDIGAYLANASYIVSVGGPPVSDLKYGVILVPVGEERLLFGKQPDNEVSHDLGDAVPDETEEQPHSRPQGSGQPGLHAVDRDSAQFRRPRFASRDRIIESIASPAIQSPVQGGEDDVCAVDNGKTGTGTQRLEHGSNGNAVDFDGDTQMNEADHPTGTESTELAGATGFAFEKATTGLGN
ncbi:hypothetical protein VP1G_08322 [Cytospora mali]|uniref:Uncharacterized protein n=1 Tax=Cytospora mali TaxID=578113 RepID=A0A194VB80_CYTMA|nr:hypothetical protein VP1G_08322 [Valsa mali var. pyri (nom. inval.)]